MKDLYDKGGEFEGIDAYIPRTDNKNDEVFEYNEETKKEISNLWSKVKIAASNTNYGVNGPMGTGKMEFSPSLFLLWALAC